MDNLILPTICILALLAFVLFSIRKQLAGVFRGEPFSDPKLRELLNRETRLDGEMQRTDEVNEFIRSYTSATREPRIRFDWNGKHAEGFMDRNMEFRHTVRNAVLEDVATTPVELIRDLFRAETQCSREAWSIVRGVDVLAEALIRRGGTEYLDDYLEGKFQSFDASLGSAFSYDLPLARAMLAEVRERLQSSPESPKAQMWRHGEDLFADWITDCEQKQSGRCDRTGQ